MRTLIAAFLGLLTTTGVARAQLSVATDFEGGSATLQHIDQATRTLRIAPGGDAKRGWPAWWCFRLDGVEPGQTLTLELVPSAQAIQTGKPIAAAWSQPDRPAISYDGKNWKQVAQPGVREGSTMRYTLAAGEALRGQKLWIAWGPPFTSADAEALVRRLDEASPDAEVFELTTTREGRKAYGLHVRQNAANTDPPYGVWIQARQHAWESGASWVARGLMEWLLSSDVRALGVRQLCDVYIVPIMDVDNTATGNGGKQAIPQDHNRDWTKQPHWPEVRAAQGHIQRLASSTGFELFIDLHNPGARDQQPYFYLDPQEDLTPRGKRNLDRWLAAAREEIASPFTLAPARPTGAKYDPLWQAMSHYWVKHRTAEHVVGATLETPWNTPHSTPEGYMQVGRQLGLTIERYLRMNPRK